jgi:hypothetical protein
VTLAEYLKREGLSDKEFGEKRCRPRLTRIEVWKLKSRLHNPRADKVAAVEHGSRGRVTAKDLIPAELLEELLSQTG